MTDVGKLLANPAAHICSAVNATTYLALSAGVNSLRLCRASVHCSGHGTLVDGLDAAPPCACNCFLGYEGTHCNARLNLETITHVVVALPVAQLTESTTLRRAAVASALQLRSSLVRVTCDAVVPMNASVVYVECEVAPVKDQGTEAYFHARVLLTAAGLTRINAALREQQLPPALFLTTRGLMTPLVANEACSGVAPNASCAVAAAFERLRVAVAHNVSVRSLRVTVTDDVIASVQTQMGQQRRQTASTTTITCVPAATSGFLGCTVSACDAALRGSVRANVTVTDIELAPATPLTGVCARPMVTTFSHAVIGNVDTTTNTTVRNAETDYTGFFAGGIAVFVIGTFVLLLAAALCMARYRKQIAEITAEVDTSNATAVDRALAWLLVRQAHHARVERAGHSNARSWASGLAVAGVSCGVIASFLVIYYRTAYGVTSNFSVLVEEFSDARCGASDTAGMPRRIFAVPPGTFECTKMLATGEATGASYALGHCTGSDGRYDATVRVAGSQGQCRKAPQLTVRSGACVPIQQLLPSATRATFAQITCSDASAVAARTTRLTELTRVPDDFVTRHVTNPPITTAAPSQVGDRFEWAFLAGTTAGQSSSNTAGTVDTFATSADLDANDDAGRLVLQTLACTFRDGAALAAASTCLKPTLEALQTNLSTRTLDNVPSLETLAPRTGDQPVGFLFGRFGSSAPVTWAGAGATAHRYYGVAGTVFDMGARFPFDPNALVDGDGYTISLFLRADASTQGFAYAVTDAFENADSGAVYTLDRLAKIIDNGQSGAEWFNTTYRVYHGLYVNGPGSALELVYADPTAIAGRVALLEFDLEEIGATRVFNSLWHHIAIVFLVENGKARAQLVVDGETSSTRKGWSACVTDFPQPVRSLGTTAPVYNTDRDTVARGGLLVTGYLNGGVAGLRAEAEEVPPTVFLRRGTTAMREYSAFPRQETLGLGAGLLALGTVMILSILWTVRREVHDASAVTESSVEVATDFYVATATLLAGTHLFGKKMTAKRSTCEGLWGKSAPSQQTAREGRLHATTTATTAIHDSSSSEYIGPLRPIRFATALRWLKLDAEGLSVVLQELQAQSRRPEQDLFLMLFRAGLALHPNNNAATTVPTTINDTASVATTTTTTTNHPLADRRSKIASISARSGGRGVVGEEEDPSNFTCDEWNELVTNDLQYQVLDNSGRGSSRTSLFFSRWCCCCSSAGSSSQPSSKRHQEEIKNIRQATRTKHQNESMAEQNNNKQNDDEEDEVEKSTSDVFSEKGKNVSSKSGVTAREELLVDLEADLALCGVGGDLFRALFIPPSVAQKHHLIPFRRHESSPSQQLQQEETTQSSALFGLKEAVPAVAQTNPLTSRNGNHPSDDASPSSNTHRTAGHPAAGGGGGGNDGGASSATQNGAYYEDDDILRTLRVEARTGSVPQKIKFKAVKFSGGGRGAASSGGASSTSAAQSSSSASSSSSGSESAISGAFSQVSAAFAPVIATVQTVYVWGTSLHLPSVYDDYFQGLFSFVSFDWAASFASIPTLVTPLIQVFVGLIAIGLVLHFMLDDNRRFEKRLAQYVWRRDELECDDLNNKPDRAMARVKSTTSKQNEMEDHEEKESLAEKDAPDGVTTASPPTAHDEETAQLGQKRTNTHGGLLRRRLDLFPAELLAAIADEGVPDAEITVAALPLTEARKIDLLREEAQKTPRQRNKMHNDDDEDDGMKIVSFNERGIPLIVSHHSIAAAKEAKKSNEMKGGEVSQLRATTASTTPIRISPDDVPSSIDDNIDEYADDNIDYPTITTKTRTLRNGTSAAIKETEQQNVISSSSYHQRPPKSECLIQTVTPFIPFQQQLQIEKRRLVKEEGNKKRITKKRQTDAPPQNTHELCSEDTTDIATKGLLHLVRISGGEEETTKLRMDGDGSVNSVSNNTAIEPSSLSHVTTSIIFNHNKNKNNNNSSGAVERRQQDMKENSSGDGRARGEDDSENVEDQQRSQHVFMKALMLAASRRMEPLRTVGCRCPRHPETRLAPQQQTEIWPFSNVPTCCMVVGGKRCGARCGTVYSCGQTYTAPRKNDDSCGEQELRVCTYALCQQHIRLSLVEQLWSVVVGLVRSVRVEGYGWVACAGLAMLASIAYTPVIKTALMILGCHPFYQCEFKNCWQHMDQKYALAVFLCIVVLCLYGVGLPAAVVFVLSRRWRMMSVFFLDPSYNGRYEQHPAADFAKAHANSNKSIRSKGHVKNSNNDRLTQNTHVEFKDEEVEGKVGEGGEAIVVSTTANADAPLPAPALPLFVSSPRRHSQLRASNDAGPFNNNNDSSENDQGGGMVGGEGRWSPEDEEKDGEEEVEGKNVMKILTGDSPSDVVHLLQIRRDPPAVSRAEWARFVATDTTAMAQQYQTVVAQWMFFAGFVIAFKVLVLLPAIFLEPRSISQRYGIAAVELVVAAFAFLTSTQISPVTLVMLRAASVHQMLLLGLQNIDLVLEHDYDTKQSADMSSSSSRVPRYADTPGAVGNYMVLVTVAYLLLCGAVIVGAVVAPILSQRLRQRQLKTFLNRNGLDYAGSISLYLDPYHSLIDPSASTASSTSLQERHETNETAAGSGDSGKIHIYPSPAVTNFAAPPPPPPPRWLEELQHYNSLKNNNKLHRGQQDEDEDKMMRQQHLHLLQEDPARAFYRLVVRCVESLNGKKNSNDKDNLAALSSKRKEISRSDENNDDTADIASATATNNSYKMNTMQMLGGVALRLIQAKKKLDASSAQRQKQPPQRPPTPQPNRH